MWRQGDRRRGKVAKRKEREGEKRRKEKAARERLGNGWNNEKEKKEVTGDLKQKRR